MAYTDGDLTILSHAPDRTVWHYKTNDTLDVVAGSGYFNAAWAKFRVFDVIHVSGDLDGTALMGRFSVSAVSTSSVTVTGWSAGAAQATLTAAGSGATGGAYATSAIRDERDAMLTAIRATLIAIGAWKGAA